MHHNLKKVWQWETKHIDSNELKKIYLESISHEKCLNSLSQNLSFLLPKYFSNRSEKSMPKRNYISNN